MAQDPRDATPIAMRPIDPHVIALFGITGDLARRKLLPGLFHLYQVGLLPEFRIVGCTRGEEADDATRALAREAVENCGHIEPTDEEWAGFAPRLTSVDITAGPKPLASVVREEQAKLGEGARLLHYLSV